jgi:hypothetical protein
MYSPRHDDSATSWRPVMRPCRGVHNSCLMDRTKPIFADRDQWATEHLCVEDNRYASYIVGLGGTYGPDLLEKVMKIRKDGSSAMKNRTMT